MTYSPDARSTGPAARTFLRPLMCPRPAARGRGRIRERKGHD
jgi:hypothetical protein